MNWGKGITIAIIAFMTYILSMVYVMFQQSNQLVEENYYEESINYEDRIQATKNGRPLEDKILVRIDDKYIGIEFPEEVKTNQITSGDIHFYRPEDGSKDKHFDFSKSGGNIQLIDKSKLSPGHYLLKLKWEVNGKNYYVEKSNINVK